MQVMQVMQVERGSYDLRFEHRPAFLVAHVSAPGDSVDVSLGFLREISAECRKCHCRRVLIVEDIPTNLSTMDMYAVGAAAPDLALRGILIAYVDLRYHTPEEDLFRETVAVNRGLTVRFFPTVAEAESWLVS